MLFSDVDLRLMPHPSDFVLGGHQSAVKIGQRHAVIARIDYQLDGVSTFSFQNLRKILKGQFGHWIGALQLR